MHHLRHHWLEAAAALRWWPEWRITVVVALAWIALLAGAGWHRGAARQTAPDTVAAEPPGHHHLHHGRATPVRGPAHGPGDGPGGLAVGLPGWTLMATAMMGPVTLPAVRHVGFNSIRRRRQWAMSLYFAVYLGVWMAFGILALAAGRLARESLGLDDRHLLGLALAVAAGWQVTRIKRRALLRCRRTTPLPPVGLRADAGCVRFALQQGWRCVTSCWALMGTMALVGHASLAWMAALTALVMAEELTLPGRRLLQPSAVALSLAAGLVILGA